MDYHDVLIIVRSLSVEGQLRLIEELTGKQDKIDYAHIRRTQFLNKEIGCPHCNGIKYYRYGKDKGSLRFKCKECHRTFTEYTGTWMAGIHKKELLNEYLELMNQDKSLDRIKIRLGINKKTAFDWRHKVLSSLEDIEKVEFNGIVESDETFFRLSDKGNKRLIRQGRKRGSDYKTKGITNDLVAVIATTDRKGTLDMKVATRGRITKMDIEKAVGYRINKNAILCADGHVSYKGFAIDHKLSLVVLRADLKQYVKSGIYHIQNVNSLHNRIKKWINSTFWGVSTKYLQNYLNWYRMKQKLKNYTSPLEELVNSSVKDMSALKRYRTIEHEYQVLNATLL